MICNRIEILNFYFFSQCLNSLDEEEDDEDEDGEFLQQGLGEDRTFEEDDEDEDDDDDDDDEEEESDEGDDSEEEDEDCEDGGDEDEDCEDEDDGEEEEEEVEEEEEEEEDGDDVEEVEDIEEGVMGIERVEVEKGWSSSVQAEDLLKFVTPPDTRQRQKNHYFNHTILRSHISEIENVPLRNASLALNDAAEELSRMRTDTNSHDRK